MSIKYEDFYLIINGKDGHYTVEAQGPGQMTTSPVPFVYQETEQLRQELKQIQSGYSPSPQAMQRIGAFLFQALMPDPILYVFGKAESTLSEESGLRLRLNIRPPELARLPWELLSGPNHKTFLATRRTRPVVRFLDSGTTPAAALEIEGPLKVLLVQASPFNLSPLNLEASEKAMRDILGRRAEITLLPDATPAKLRDLLSSNKTFHILHYDGHGFFDQYEERGLLALMNEKGGTQTLSGSDLSNYLDGTNVRLVVLAACQTGQDGIRQRFVGFAQRLMQTSELPAVVAMQFAIPDQSAIAFIRGFYGALADGYPVDAAIAEGRMAILEVTSEKAPDWATPLLLMRTTNGQLWKQLIDGQEAKPLLTSRAPYLGLRTFQEEDAEFFFGREKLVKLLIEKVANQPFLAVLGPSGSGKSSTVLAGLLPALKDGALPGSERWSYLTIKPGARPLNALAATLSKLQEGVLGNSFELRKRLASDEQALLLAADVILTDTSSSQSARANSDARLVLVVDQFEELWTQVPTVPKARQLFIEQEQRQFLRLLLAILQTEQSPLLLIITMRADFLHRAAENRDLARAIEKHLVIVSPMQPNELRQAIVEPAKLAGGVFEPGLVDELIIEVQKGSGALPLLEYTLLELWKAKQSDGTMTWESFHALGGVEGALAARADKILATHYSPQEQETLRHLLLHLVQPGEGAADTRRRAQLSDLVPAGSDADNVQRLLKPLVDERLLTTSRDSATREETVELSHEALIRAWPTFSEWINDAREDLHFQLQLEEAAKEWQANEEKDDYLWRGLRLANAKAWLERAQPRLNERDQRFLETSRRDEQARQEAEEAARREREQLLEAQAAAEKRNASRLRTFLIVASVLLAVASALAVLAFNAQQQATTEANRAESAATQEAIARQEAEEQAHIAQSQAHASEALLALANDQDDRALLLALAAAHETENYPAITQRALRSTLDQTLIRHTLRGDTDFVWSVAFSPDGQLLLMGSFDGTARLWDTQTGQLLHVLEGHTGPVGQVVFSPDGQLLLTGSEDGTARLWNTQTGQLRHALEEHTDFVWSVAFSPDGQQLLTGSFDGTARLWDTQTGQLRHALEGHTEAVWSVAFSPDGQLLLTGGSDGTARLWETQTGQLRHALEGHTGVVSSVAFNPDGKLLLTGSNDETARLWETQTGQLRHALEGHTDQVLSVAFSPDGQLLLTGSQDRTARLWETQTGQLRYVLEGHTNLVWSVAFSPDGQHLLTGSEDRTARLWNTQTGQLLHALEGHTASVGSVAFSSDGKLLLTGSGDGTIRLWETKTDQLLLQLEGHTASVESVGPVGPVGPVAFSPDGQLLLTSSSDGTARLWETQTGQLRHTLEGHTASVESVAFSPNGLLLLTGSSDRTASLWETQTGQLRHALEGHIDTVSSVAFNPDGKLLLTGSGDGTARLWNAQTSQLLHVLEGHTGAVRSVAFSPDGQLLLTGSEDGTARLWETQTGQLRHALEAHTDFWLFVLSVAFSPDGQHLLTSRSDGTTRLWETQTGQLRHTLEGHTDFGLSVGSAAFNPDGKLLLTGSGDGTARLWETQTGQLRHALEGHTDQVPSVAFSPDGQQVLTGSYDNTARLWDVNTGQLIHALEGHTDGVYSVAFSPDGTQVLTVSQDGTARLWLVDDALIMAKLTERVCHVLTEETIRAEIPEWGGCEAELEAVAEELAEYERVWGQKRK